MTPKHTSVLMTPSSTKPVFYSPRVLSPTSLCLLSPPVTPKTSLGLTPSPPAYKDILSELYLGGQPLVAKRIFSFLNPADLCSSLQVCTTWNLQVSCGAQFMNKVSTYHNSAKRMPKTCTKLKNQWKPQSLPIRGDHWLTSPPTPSHNSRLQNQHPQPHSLASA